MTEPLVALLLFAAFALAAAALFWPGRGLLARYGRLSRLDERVRLEDALKHVYTCERRGESCSLESLAGRLEIPTSRAAELLSRLTALGLVVTDGAGPRLSEEGRNSALRIVRTHRLWERYLADRTGVPPAEWHDHAERMEHSLSAGETEALSLRLGHPRWDPHGDPIPTPEGDMPPFRGTTLMDVRPGRSVEVIHLEDEPKELYQRLVDQGLAPGTRLDLLARSETSVEVRSEGSSWTLEPVAAGQVTVRELPMGERADGPAQTLLDVEEGESVRVVGLARACQGPQRRRLLDLGLVRGTTVVPKLTSAAGDPVAYEIRGALIALRSEQAGWVFIERVAEVDAPGSASPEGPRADADADAPSPGNSDAAEVA